MKKVLLASAAALICLGSAAFATCRFYYPKASPSSFWYQQIPANAPLHPLTSTYRTEFLRKLSVYGSAGTSNIRSFSGPLYIAPKGTTRYNIKQWDCQHTGFSDPYMVATEFANVPIPFSVVPADGGDSSILIYDEETDTYWDFWQISKDINGAWQACWGGRMLNVTTGDGRMSHPPYSQTATRLPVALGQVRIEELRTGHIDHVIGLSTRENLASYMWPAQGQDGTSTSSSAWKMGQRIRIDPTLDLSTLNLNPWALTIARAAQTYGFVVWDTGDGIYYENPYRYEKEGWPTTIYSDLRAQLGVTAGHEMDNFPWSYVQFMPDSYGQPGTAGVDPTWTPANLGSNLSIWLDSSVSASMTVSGGKVSQWCDPRETAGSCTKINAVQATSANQPTFGANGVSFWSGGAQYFNLSSPITGGSTYTCWAKMKSVAAPNTFPLGNSAGSAPYPIQVKYGVLVMASQNGYASPSVTWADSAWHVWNSSSNNASANSGFDFWLDGIQSSVGSYASSPRGSTWNTIGRYNTLYSDMYIKEMFCSSAVESDLVKANGRAYLNAKWP